MARRDIPIICYDLPTISRFFRSCALMVATQQTTHIQWTTYRDSKVLNAVYAVFFWKEPPGFAEVSTSSSAEITRKTDELHAQYMTTWVTKLMNKGPAEAQAYVAALDRIKAYAREAIQSIYAEASSINSEVIGQTQQAITNLARIKLGAQVGVAVIGAVTGIAFVGAAAAGTGGGATLSILGLEAGSSALGFGVTGAAHSVTHSLIKSWDDGNKAVVVGVSTEVGKAGANEIGGQVAGASLEKALAGSARATQIIRSAEGEINKQAARLAKEGIRKKAAAKATNIIAQRSAQVGVQQTAMKGFETTARNAVRAGTAIPVVFAAWDIWDAVGDYRDTMAGNR